MMSLVWLFECDTHELTRETVEATTPLRARRFLSAHTVALFAHHILHVHHVDTIEAVKFSTS